MAQPGATLGEATRTQGQFIRDVIKLNLTNFRVFSPDEINSNRWNAVFEVTNRCSTAATLAHDDHVAADGRVKEMLSEHPCEGWLEGYLLTGRHGFFSCYEAFIHIIASMFNQHAKWLDVAGKIPWRQPIASLNYLLTSHIWRQDHNGFSHQDPGFLDVVANKKAKVIRIYLPPDANTLLSVTDHCLRSRNYVNVIVAGRPIIFAHHGYPMLIHRLTYRRTNHAGLHVHGFNEEGTTTTPFDMTVLNGCDRFHLALSALKHLPQTGESSRALKQLLEAKLIGHTHSIEAHGEDMPEIREWKWSQPK